MTGREIIDRVKELNLSKDSYLVFGSCPMAIAGIREARDVDMYVTPEVLNSLESKGWKMVVKGPKDTPYTYDIYEAHDNWDFSSYNPTLEELKSRENVVEGVPFASLDDVLKWKQASDNPKFKRDADLIKNFLNKKSGEV